MTKILEIDMNRSQSKIRHMLQTNILLEQRRFTLSEQNDVVNIIVKNEGWLKIPQDLITTTDLTPKCVYSGYHLSFKHNNIFYDIDMRGTGMSGVRNSGPDDSESFESLHKSLITEGIIEGVFMCGTNDSLITPLDYQGVKYSALIDGSPASEVLTNVKPGDKTVFGGFDGQGTNFILVNNGGTWIEGSLSYKKLN